MRLARVTLQNFRCYKTGFTLELGNLTTLIGKNEAGKSTILDALQIFFEETTPDPDDATTTGDKGDVRIICEFEQLPRAIILDADHPTDLAAEHLLNEEGRLEIHKVYNCSLKKPRLDGVYARCVHPTTDGYSDLLQLKNAELKARARELGVATEGLDVRINTLLRRAIWSVAEDLGLSSTLVPLNVETAKRIWDMLKTRIKSAF